VRVYLLILLVAAATTFLLAGLVRRIGVAVGAMTEVRDRDVHVTPIPRLGGVAMLAGVATALVAARQFPLIEQVFGASTDAQALLTAGAVICLVGVADDIWGLDALTKFAGQVLAAGVMVVQGVQLYWLPWAGGTLSLNSAQGTLLTVLVVVVTINAVNFVDGLDGLAAGVVAIGAAAFFVYSYLLAVEHGLQRATTPALIAAILMGICLGFLPHNFAPARVFMGDSGAMLLGLLFAASSITLTGQVDPGAVQIGVLAALLPLILPIAVLAVPIIDLLLAVVRRTWAGRSPFHPDKMHLHHRLLDIGHSQRRAVLIMYGWSATIAFGVVTVSLVDGWGIRVAVAAAVLTITAATVLLPLLEQRFRRARAAS
jgi:UDP-GlcNAc:undecaprenyl-phosphate GlcNAc-1-phosphate transferase